MQIRGLELDAYGLTAIPVDYDLNLLPPSCQCSILVHAHRRGVTRLEDVILCKKAFDDAVEAEQGRHHRQDVDHGKVMIDVFHQAIYPKALPSDAAAYASKECMEDVGRIGSAGFLGTHRDKNPFIHSNMCGRFAERRELLLKFGKSALAKLNEDEQTVMLNRFALACKDECLAAGDYITYYEARAGL